MRNDRKPRQTRSWRGALQQASVLVLLSASAGALVGQIEVSAQARAGGAPRPAEDPCRFATAAAVGTAFGQTMQSSRLGDSCQYRSTPTALVVVKVQAGPEGTIFRYAKGAVAQRQQGVEKVATPAGEGYFDATLPAFIGRVGNNEVQIESTIQPVPRAAMIAVGARIMSTLAGK